MSGLRYLRLLSLCVAVAAAGNALWAALAGRVAFMAVSGLGAVWNTWLFLHGIPWLDAVVRRKLDERD